MGAAYWTTLEFFIRAQKKLSAIGAWENSKKASIEAELKKIEVISHYLFCNIFLETNFLHNMMETILELLQTSYGGIRHLLFPKKTKKAKQTWTCVMVERVTWSTQ